MIDLRSDTVTQPTEAMRAAMVAAEVGDDVYGEDPTVRRLEERVAELFGFEAALFTVTGSLANLLAVRALVGVGEEVLCESSAHIARAELGAHGAFTGLTMRTWSDPRGYADLAAIEALVAPDLGPYFVTTKALSVENTHNFAGGRVQPLEVLDGATRAGRPARTPRPPRRRPDLERARRDRRSPSRTWPRAPTRWASACPRAWAPRSAR